MQLTGTNIAFYLKKAVGMFACFLMGIILLGWTASASKVVSDVNPPFAPGEKLTFALKWTVVPAGEAVMEVLPMQTINGVQAYHFRLTAESNSFVDIFYKVRDRIDAYVAADMSGTVHFRKKQHEGEHRKNLQVNFDLDKGTAQYKDEEKAKKPIKIKPGTFDPLSVFYFSRTQAFKENGVIKSMVTDGVKCVEGIGRIVKRETIEVPSGTYDTYLIEPDLKHVGGVFKKSKNAKIQLWVTADHRRIPVKIASEVAVGSFIGELVAVEHGLKDKT